jgi:signal transduction histidine kinase
MENSASMPITASARPEFEKKNVSSSLRARLAQAAHDVRAPLTALKAMAGLLQQRITPTEYELLSNTVQRLQSISQDFLKDAVQCASQVVSLNQMRIILSDLSSQYSVSHPQVTVQIESLFDFKGRMKLGIDEQSLYRVLANVIQNAVESFEQDGAGLVAFFVSQEGDYLCLEISDNGKGIPAEILAKLGERGLTHGKANGTGLGVPYIISTMRRFGGEANFESREQMGTKVKLSLPIVIQD